MPDRDASRPDDVPGKPWSVVVLSDDVTRARQWVQTLAEADLRFVCAGPDRHERIPGAWSAFDLVVLHLGRERAHGVLPKHILQAQQRCLVFLGRPATGAERAWWIESGADDCISQPCDRLELLARLRAALRRQPGRSHPLNVGRLALWTRERVVTLDGRTLALTTCEFSLLIALAEHAGQVLGREALLAFAKGSAEQAFERAIDVQISRLRAKLGDDPRQPRLLKTVRGLGYVLVAEPSLVSSGVPSTPPAR
jgi:DNA-binding response OmpR family regulator